MAASRSIAKPKSEDLALDVWHKSYSNSDLQAYRRKLAKRANQRLLRLERAKSAISDERFAGIGASEKAYAYLERQKAGRRRFVEKEVDLDYQAIRHEINVLQRFLESKSSLVSGLREIEAKRISTFESGEWGSARYVGKRKALKFASTKEFYDFFHSSTYQELYKSGFTSEQLIEAYDTARETYEGSDRDAIDALEGALETFRAKGASLKELRAAARGQPLR